MSDDKGLKTCLLCDELKEGVKRGLCPAHYEQYRREKVKLKKAELGGWEEMLVKEGRILPDSRTTDNVFAEAAERYRISKEATKPSPKRKKSG